MSKKSENRVQRNEVIMQVSNNDYAYQQQVDPRRRPEFNDSQMIQEDHNAMANLSPNFIHREFRPGKFQPNYWMESEIEPVPFIRANKPEEL